MTTFTTDELAEAQNILRATVKENHEHVSVRKGTVVNELLLALQALGFAEINKRIEELKATQSLQYASESPDAVDDSIIDAILSNLLLTRKEGSASRGYLKILTISNRARGIPQGTEFTTLEGLVFVTETDLVAEVDPVSATSLPIREEEGTANYYILVPVVAAEVGDQYSIAQDTQLENTSLGTDVVLITAFTGFSEGKDREETSDLLERAKDAVTVRDLASPKSIRMVLRDQFPTIEDISVIGYGDREMARDKYGGFGLGAGGKVNIYARTSLEPFTEVLVKTVSTSATISLDAAGTEVPFYKVLRVSPIRSPGLALPYTVSYSFAGNPANELLGVMRLARFSVYEKATLTLSTAAYNSTDVLVTIVRPPIISEIQRYVLDDDYRVAAADLLVYGVTPCYTTVSFSYYRDAFSPTVNLTDMKDLLKKYINTLPIGQPLSASKIVALIHSFDVIRVSLPTLLLKGELLRADGEVISLASADLLEIPTRNDLQLSQRTAAYFITSDDIVVSEINL